MNTDDAAYCAAIRYKGSWGKRATTSCQRAERMLSWAGGCLMAAVTMETGSAVEGKAVWEQGFSSWHD